MPDLKKLLFSSKSSRNSSKKQESNSSRRLTRQHKIRHVSDGRLGSSLRERWPDELPRPQPLPLPEFNRRLREKGSDQLFKQSSNEGMSKGDVNGSDARVGIKPSSLGFDRSSHSLEFVDKTPNHPTPKSDKPPTYFRRGFPLIPNDETDTRNFKLNVPARSAPTSALSSPLRSPQRFNTVNFLPSSNPQNTNFHNVHPLPLPPSSPRRTQSPTNTSTTEKPEATSAKSQWVKGKFIGRGTYGSVFEAINSETGAMCALKEVDIIPDDPKSVECIKQLEQEIKILQHLEHKNIVRYYGCEVVGDHFCIYLEYVHPGSINKYARDHFGAITESVVRNFTRHILSGLAYLHSTDTVHRDIKGANLLVDASGVVKLADFGLAKHLTVAATDLSLKGSPYWMAPELLQAVMRKDSDHQHAFAIDIWSLGCTVIEMFNGKPPWSECTGVQALFHVMNKSPVIPESLSVEGKDFLSWCFKRNPAERPTAAQLLKHPFARTTNERAFSTCIPEFSGIKLADSSNSPRQQPNVNRSLPTSPRTQSPLPNNGRSFNDESSREASHQSPSSILEMLPSISSPEFCSNSPVNNSYTTSQFAICLSLQLSKYRSKGL